MNTDRNKATAQRFFELVLGQRPRWGLALMTDDATSRIPGKKELTRLPASTPRNESAACSAACSTTSSAGCRDCRLLDGRGRRVALEVTSSGDLKNGRLYRQEYHFIMEFRDGKICAVREYLDTSTRTPSGFA